MYSGTKKSCGSRLECKTMKTRLIRCAHLLLCTVLIGTATGGGAIILHYLLDIMQELTFGHTEAEHPIVTDHSDTVRRVLVLIAVGAAVSIIWFLLQRRTKLVSVKAQIRGETPQERRPGFLRQTLHSLTQIVAVGAGAPVGKEVAPRELGALFAGRLADLMRIPQTVRPVLVASAAAAGLAAVYQVPVGGFVFLFEALSLALSLRNIFTGAILIFVATCTAHLVIPDAPTYPVPQLQTTGESLLLAVVLGLAITPLALWFRAASQRAESRKTTNRNVLWRLPLVLVLVAVTSIFLPEILGNGRPLTQHIFDAASGLSSSSSRLDATALSQALLYALALLAAKAILVVASLRNGAYGGTLTPGLALGSACGFVLTGTLILVFPTLTQLQPGAGALHASELLGTAGLLGAVTFLSLSMNAPLSACALILGFAGQDWQAYAPFAVAVGTAWGVKYLWMRLGNKTQHTPQTVTSGQR